jgi:ribosomal-protein-alanine N-acetyltransferase
MKLCGYNKMVNFGLRDFRREDFDSLWRIDQECFAPGIAYSRLELAAYIRLRGAFTIVAEALSARHKVAESTPIILGFIVAQTRRRGVGHVLTIDVPTASRRFGIGSRLLSAAEDRLHDAACHSVVLETAVDNATALVFYKRHGYIVARTIPRYYSNGVDAFLMEKQLHSASARSGLLR